jgi:predicted transcriptional regulator
VPNLAPSQIAALRFMSTEPLRIDAFSPVVNVEGVAAMLDELARTGLCHRTLDGLNRVYSITPDGVEVLSRTRASENGVYQEQDAA